MKKDVKTFLKVSRKASEYRNVCERIKDYEDVTIIRQPEVSQEQSSRCMDCGTPFCHWSCPLGNYIPDWNQLIFEGKWEEALKLLHETNNFPEFTGRLCPAFCEYSCVLGINDEPVTIRENELAIIEYAFEKGLMKKVFSVKRTDKKIAVIGSGPAGLAVADQLNKAGHKVVVLEKDAEIGGILRFGIPDFKLDKSIIDRRVNFMKEQGIEFKPLVNVGVDYPIQSVLDNFDAVCLTVGSSIPRDLDIPGRNLENIHFAMDYLVQNNIKIYGINIPQETSIDAKNKRVVIIGGGDTGSDCLGTALRQGASCVVQIEVMPKPPEDRTDQFPWPNYPMILKTSSSHKEGGERNWAILTKKFVGEKGCVKKIQCCRVEFVADNQTGRTIMKELAGTQFEIEADLVILAIGFIQPKHEGLVNDLDLTFDERGNIKTGDSFKTNLEGVFSAGDARRGQSVIVWAISEGRKAAYHIDSYLMGKSKLPSE